jgi:GT2 family glycosyltransferase
VNIATGDIVVLLNTDVIPSEGYLKPLLVHFADPLVFAVGCLDKSIERNASVDRGRGKIFWSKGFLMHKKEVSAFGKTGWVSGGSGAFRRSIWNILGGMDPLYNPFYWEDIDLSYRANKAGYLTFFDPTSMVTHLHEQGKIMKEYSQTVVKTIAYRNQFIFVWKNISNPTLILDHFFRLPIHLLQAITRGDMPFILGFLFSCAKAPKIFFSRRRAARLWKKSDTELFKL